MNNNCSYRKTLIIINTKRLKIIYNESIDVIISIIKIFTSDVILIFIQHYIFDTICIGCAIYTLHKKSHKCASGSDICQYPYTSLQYPILVDKPVRTVFRKKMDIHHIQEYRHIGYFKYGKDLATFFILDNYSTWEQMRQIIR